MKSRALILCGLLLLFPLRPSFSQSGTKTWTQSTPADFAGNQLMNVVPAPSGGVWIAPAFSKTVPDHIDDALLRFAAKDGAGKFVVTWMSGGSVFAQRYSSAGVALGGSIAVNDVPAGTDGQSRAALFDDGTYVIVWNDSYLPGDGSDKMHGQIIRYDDTKTGSNFVVNDTANYSDNHPAAFANSADNSFWLFYPLITPQGYRIHVQKRDKNGNKIGDTFLLSTGNVTTFEGNLAVSVINGGFAVAWEGNNDIYLREFSLAGEARTPAIKVNDDPGANARYQPALCWDGNANLVVAWADQRGADQKGGIVARIFGQVFDGQCARIGANVSMEDAATLDSRSPDVEYSLGQYHVSWLVYNASLRRYQITANAWIYAPTTSGTMISSVFDAGPGGTALKSISWDVEGTAHGSVLIKVKSADILEGLQSTPWHGPGDTAGFYTTPSGEQIGTSAPGGRFVQYAAFFESVDGQSPVLHSVSIAYANLDTIPPAKPSSLAATPAHHSITLSWIPNREADLAGYLIYRATKSGAYDGSWKKSVPAGQTSYVDYTTGLDTVYFFAVSAFDSCHNESAHRVGHKTVQRGDRAGR